MCSNFAGFEDMARIPTTEDLTDGPIRVFAWDHGYMNTLRGKLIRIDADDRPYWPYVIEDDNGQLWTFPYCDIEEHDLESV